MAIDFNEARATIEEAKKRGLIRSSDSKGTVSPDAPAKPKPEAEEKESSVVLPDWLLGKEVMPRPAKRPSGN